MPMLKLMKLMKPRGRDLKRRPELQLKKKPINKLRRLKQPELLLKLKPRRRLKPPELLP